jgi:hypothetical protein
VIRTLARPLLNERFTDYPPGAWADGTDHKRWHVEFTSDGHIVATGWRLHIEPANADTTGQDTRSALVVTRRAFTTARRPVTFEVTARTVAQLKAHPNPWEVDWMFWNLTWDPASSSYRAYWALAKTDGIEVGKLEPAYPGRQRFLHLAPTPACPVGTTHRYRITQHGNEISVWLDDTPIVRGLRDTEHPYLSGHLGLYVEDAHATYGPVVVRRGGRS